MSNHTDDCPKCGEDLRLSPFGHTCPAPKPPKLQRYITTRSGRQFVLEAPTVEMINIGDIAHALSMICHFGGHVKEFFSVAQHSVCVAQICPPELKKWGLLHDAAEAYIGDMVRPLKYMMPEYREMEERIMYCIAEKFDLSWPEPPELKALDDSIIKLEASLYMKDAILSSRDGSPAQIADAPWLPHYYTAAMSPTTARLAFMREYRELFLGERKL